MNTKNIMNWVLYGNTKGIPTNMGKVSNKYDDFINKVLGKCELCGHKETLEHCDNKLCHSCYVEQTVTDDEQ